MDGALALFYLVCALVSLTCVVLLTVMAPHHTSDLAIRDSLLSETLGAESAVAVRAPEYKLEDTYVLPDEEGDNGLGAVLTWSKSLRILAVGESRTGVGSGRVVLLKHVTTSTINDDGTTTVTHELRRGGTFESDFENDRFSAYMAWGRRDQVLTVCAPGNDRVYTYQVSVNAAGDVSSDAVVVQKPTEVDFGGVLGAPSYGVDDRHIIVAPTNGNFAHIFYKVPRSVSMQWMDAATSPNAAEWIGGAASSNGLLYMFGGGHVEKYRNKGASYVHVERASVSHDIQDVLISEDGIHGVFYVNGRKLLAFRDDGTTDTTNYGALSDFETDLSGLTRRHMAMTSSGALVFVCGLNRVQVYQRTGRNSYTEVDPIARPDGTSVDWPSSVACTFGETGRHTVFTADDGTNRVYSHYAQI